MGSKKLYTERRPKKGKGRLLIIYLVIAVVGFGLGSYLKYSSNPNACSGCHAMKPQVKTWQVTAHNNIKCDACHKNVSLPTFAFRQMTERYKLPLTTDVLVEDETCLGCHNPKRIVTPPGDLVIPHYLHLEKGIDCIDCHDNVTHANVSEKVIAAGIDPNTFTIDDAAKVATMGNRIPMDKCMECHNGAMATRDCNACHNDKTAPTNHGNETWAIRHGIEAFKNVDGCNACHEYDVAKKGEFQSEDDTLINVRKVARTNAFCYNCHIDRPQSHTKVYSVDHPEKARAFPEGCLACHNKDKEEQVVSAPTTQVYCEQCHFSLHPADWEPNHKNKVHQDGDAQCYDCHDASSCASCHKQARKDGRI
ncbi:NapC/NirT family cytochrome c [Metallumcola ferriviriculae]|uniref:NapC/NirT family cytochrome c n=1 Tax=Metallumcola ferriviriculae TaxID=3039180 RepID=A0AAU0UP93_9FIRM|nr:NapC/NirT family cytochrome c [Desulfitibacteraceae bacterium MK1]